jgi:hypothetical protein
MFNTGVDLNGVMTKDICLEQLFPISQADRKLQKVRQADYEEQRLEETRKKTLIQLNSPWQLL